MRYFQLLFNPRAGYDLLIKGLRLDFSLKNYLKKQHVIYPRDLNIVKIEPNGCLETHCHENEMELHEVIEGGGLCQLLEKTIDYNPGEMAVILKGEKHMVQAGETGLTLLAKFFPALI